LGAGTVPTPQNGVELALCAVLLLAVGLRVSACASIKPDCKDVAVLSLAKPVS